MKKYLTATLLGLLFLAGCGDSGSSSRDSDFVPLTSIEVTSETPQIADLTSTQFTAIGNFSGFFTRDITEDVTWESSDPGVATISNDPATIGRASSVTSGETTITATQGDVSGSFALTVTDATISTLVISPLEPSRPKGLTAQFQADGTFSDATTQDLTFDVSWASTDPTVTTISNAAGSKGLASALETGTSTISATFDGTSASTSMTVSAALLNSIELEPLSPSILSLSSGQFSATGTFSDGSTLDITDQVTWDSSLSSIATISNTAGSQGLVATLRDGSTSISASLDGITESTSLSVTGGDLLAINVLPENSTQVDLDPVIPIQMTAEGVFTNAPRDISDVVTWSSSNSSVATIDSQGIVTTVSPGSTTIEAVSGDVTGRTNLNVVRASFISRSLTITPTTLDRPTIALNTSQTFTASGDFSDGSTRDLTSEVTWSTSAPEVATVSNADSSQGVAIGVADGTATISADFRGLDSDSSDLIVTAPTLLSVTITPTGRTILPGQSLQFTATASYDGNPVRLDITNDVVWTSANTSIAIFQDPLNAQGEITGVDSGSVVITAEFGGEFDSVTLVVTP